jgi:hypothetical protein
MTISAARERARPEMTSPFDSLTPICHSWPLEFFVYLSPFKSYSTFRLPLKVSTTLHANFPPLSTVTSTMHEEIASESLENPSTSCRPDRAADANNNQSATDEGAIQKQTSPTGPMVQISNTERLVAEQHSLSYSLTREHTPTPPDLVIHADVQADVIMEETTTDSGPKSSSTDAMGVRLLQLSGTKLSVFINK